MSIGEFLDLMPSVVTVESYASVDSYGKPAYGDPVQYVARVVVTPTRMQRADGTQIVSRATVYIGAAVLISPKDRLTVPSVFLPAGVPPHPPILDVQIPSDELGPHHTVVLI